MRCSLKTHLPSELLHPCCRASPYFPSRVPIAANRLSSLSKRVPIAPHRCHCHTQPLPPAASKLETEYRFRLTFWLSCAGCTVFAKLRAMGGGNRRRSGKNNRQISSKSSFIAGGILSDFQNNGSDSWSSNPGFPPRSSSSHPPPPPPSKGRQREIVSLVFGNAGKSGRLDGSASTGRARRRSSNPFGYPYPTVDLQEPLHAESGDGSNASPLILVDSNGTRIVGHEERTPCLEHAAGKTFTYDYGSSSVLGESCHQGLGFYDENVETDGGEGDEQGVVLEPVENEIGIEKHAGWKGK